MNTRIILLALLGLSVAFAAPSKKHGVKHHVGQALIRDGDDDGYHQLRQALFQDEDGEGYKAAIKTEGDGEKAEDCDQEGKSHVGDAQANDGEQESHKGKPKYHHLGQALYKKDDEDSGYPSVLKGDDGKSDNGEAEAHDGGEGQVLKRDDEGYDVTFVRKHDKEPKKPKPTDAASDE